MGKKNSHLKNCRKFFKSLNDMLRVKLAVEILKVDKNFVDNSFNTTKHQVQF